MKLYRLTEVSPDGEVEVVKGWYTTGEQAEDIALELDLRRFEITPFSGAEIAWILTREKVYQ